MKLILILLAFTSSFAFAQSEEVGIRHFQRKSTEFDFCFPNEAFSPEGLTILIPDSIYSFGTIRVKKIDFPSFSVRNYELNFQSDSIRSVVFQIRGKKNSDSLTELLRKKQVEVKLETLDQYEDTFFLELMEIGKIGCTIQRKRKKYHVQFISN